MSTCTPTRPVTSTCPARTSRAPTSASAPPCLLMPTASSWGRDFSCAADWRSQGCTPPPGHARQERLALHQSAGVRPRCGPGPEVRHHLPTHGPRLRRRPPYGLARSVQAGLVPPLHGDRPPGERAERHAVRHRRHPQLTLTRRGRVTSAREALQEVCAQLATDREIVLCSWDAASNWGVQVADYGLWVVQRHLEGRTSRWLETHSTRAYDRCSAPAAAPHPPFGAAAVVSDLGSRAAST